MDTLDFIWFGMKLGVAMIGMVMVRSLWREVWRSKRAGEQKDKQAMRHGPEGPCKAMLHE